MWNYISYDELYHHGIKGQKWGIRRFQNSDGTLTAAGRERMVRDKHRIESKSKKRAIAAAVAGTAVNQAAKQATKAINKKAMASEVAKKALKVARNSAVLGATGRLRARHLRPEIYDVIDGAKVGIREFTSNPIVQSFASTGIRYLAKSGLMSIGMAAVPAALVVSGSMIAASLIKDTLNSDSKLRRDYNEERQIQEKYNIKKKVVD